PNPVHKSPMVHFAGRLDPASILLHRHGHLPIMHIEPQIQSSDHYVVLSCLVPDSLRYCCVWFIIHNADSLAASADKLSAHVIYFDSAPSALECPKNEAMNVQTPGEAQAPPLQVFRAHQAQVVRQTRRQPNPKVAERIDSATLDR